MRETVTGGEFTTLSSLLTNCTIKFDANDSEGNAVPHPAVPSACHKGESNDSFYHCFNLLMKLNIPNKEAYTAIEYDLYELNRTCVEHVLKHPSAKSLYLDYYPADSEYI